MKLKTENWNRFLKAASKEVRQKAAEDSLEEAALDFSQSVIAKTPRGDANRLRSGWAAYPFSKGKTMGLGKVNLKGLNASDFREKFGTDKPSITILNGVWYGRFLEFGTQKLSPVGMMRGAFRELRAKSTLPLKLRKSVRRAFVRAAGRAGLAIVGK